MKFIDVIYIMLILCMISAAIVRFGNCFLELDSREQELVYQKESLSFISQSFVNCCRGHGFSDLNEWQKCCRAMWSLDYIAWSDAASFMPLEGGKLVYAKWNNEALSGEIYCKKGN